MCPLSPLPSGRMSGGNTDILWGINHLSREELGELEIREIIMTLGVTNTKIIICNKDDSAIAGQAEIISSHQRSVFNLC